ncbi:MAG: aldo/keto reductase, partial [Victivallales bacterium]
KLCFVRSIYLQGLLLMSPAEVGKKLSNAVGASEKWNSIAEKHSMTKAELAAKFAISLNLPIVVGMDSSSQAKENLELFSKPALDRKTADEISREMTPFLTDDILNPSKWNQIK